MNEKKAMSDKGYESVPVIARRLGWSPGKIYRHIEREEVVAMQLATAYVQLDSVFGMFEGDARAELEGRYRAAVKTERKEAGRRESSSGKRKVKGR